MFAAVAWHGSIHAAAESLHVTGSAVSQHIRRLERETGCRLVERNGRGIRLTHTGRVLATSAQKMTSVAAQAGRDLATINDLVAGPLRIGAFASALRALMPQTLLALTNRYPRLEPQLWDREVVHMLPELQTEQLDAVVTESWSHAPARIPSGVETRTLVHEQALLAVHHQHPLAHLRQVPVSSLHGLPWASCDVGSDAHQALIQLLHQHSVTDVHVHYRIADYHTQLDLVAAGVATALVPRMALPPDTVGVRLVPCKPLVTRTVSVATLQGKETPATHAFVTELARVAGNIVAGESSRDV